MLPSTKLKPDTVIVEVGVIGMTSGSLVMTATHGGGVVTELAQSSATGLETKRPKNVFDAKMLVKDSDSMAGVPVGEVVTGMPLNKSGMLEVE